MNGVVLDTNVVSEPRRPRLDFKVLAWLADQAPKNLFLTATVVGELGVGMTTLPSGRRRSSIEAWLAGLLEKQFAGRVLPYDAEAALAFAELFAAARARGRDPKLSDAQIAAVAQVNDMVVARWDVGDFKPLGVTVINPWDPG